tara:strand:+ start:157 stop:348 length:192 start_codon:yes stop_codon:yes gene_type:complete
VVVEEEEMTIQVFQLQVEDLVVVVLVRQDHKQEQVDLEQLTQVVVEVDLVYLVVLVLELEVQV